MGRKFSFQEMSAATNNLSEENVIGVGGFGKVFKGNIDEESVSIKKYSSSNSIKGKRNFLPKSKHFLKFNISISSHSLGTFVNKGEMILLYEYMSNGTLEDHLSKHANEAADQYTPLSWEQRLQILIQAARGIDYLHTANGVLHRESFKHLG